MARITKKERKQVLLHVDLGSAVAEQDNNLPDYYVENRYFHSALDFDDRHVLFIGKKGSGKSAILQMVKNSVSGHKIIKLGADDIAM